MKPYESAPGNTENVKQPTDENSPWDTLAEVPFDGGGDVDENAGRVRENMVPDDTAASEEQENMQKEQEEADQNIVAGPPTEKDFENYVDSILSDK